MSTTEPFAIDKPRQLLDHLNRREPDSICLDISVRVSSQDARDIATSIFDAIFVTEALTASLGSPTLSTIDSAGDPNSELVRLCGTVEKPDSLIAFLMEWLETLDSDSDEFREPFSSSDDGARLFERLEAGEPASAFRWPVLVTWYREARSEFDDWEP